MARIPEIVTPHKIVKSMVDMLPSEIWNSKTKFLDPACKGGEYLREIYDRLMETELLQLEFPNAIERSNHILKNQIYGIALSQVSFDRTTKKLFGEDRNLRIITDYINKLRGINMGIRPDGKCKNIVDILNEEFGRDMKFDVVIGNPPYQENNSQNGRQSKPIYDRFIEAGIELSHGQIVFITNNTFLTNDSKKELRNKMISAGLKKLYNYPLSGDIFKGVGVSACIFVINKHSRDNIFEYKRIERGKVLNQYTTEIYKDDIIAESKYEMSIPKKINVINNMGQMVIGDKTFGIASSGRIGFSGKGDYIDYSMLEFNNCIKLKNKFDETNGVTVYISREDVPKGIDYIGLYKVICPLIISKSSLNSFNKAEILEPDHICTQNWSTLGVFNEVEPAVNLTKYMKTNFFQFLAYVYCSNAMTYISKVLMEHIPLQDFSSSSDIDWSQPISDIDKQLYTKYNLTKDEIEYIEKIIKSIT